MAAAESTPVLKSKGFWGFVLGMVPFIDQAYQYAQDLPVGVLPPQAKIVLTGVGLLLALIGRATAKGPLTLISP